MGRAQALLAFDTNPCGVGVGPPAVRCMLPIRGVISHVRSLIMGKTNCVK